VPTPSERYVCALVGLHHVAFPIDEVQEVLAPRAITRLFHAPAALLGVVNLRGEILPVFDLASLLGAGASSDANGRESEARLVVLRATLEADARRQASFAIVVTRLEPLRDGPISALPAGVPAAAARVGLGILASATPAAMVIDPTKLVALDDLSALRA
jgi:chemotaxis signal transduction protein